MIVIAEAGASKINWGIIVNKKIIEFTTSGFNPNTSDRNYLRQLLISGYPKDYNPNNVEIVEYFGAGCGSQKNKDEVIRALSNFFSKASTMQVYSDLEAAGRIFFNNELGYVGVLGTGSSFGYYNGSSVDMVKPSLGFLLGDEGGGAYMGKQLVAKILLCELPKPIVDRFFKEYSSFTSSQQLFNTVNNHAKPNAILASFVPFIKKNLNNDVLAQIVKLSFNIYVQRYVLPTLEEKGKAPIGLVGSVAYYFSKALKQSFFNNGVQEPSIIEKPFNELLKRYL